MIGYKVVTVEKDGRLSSAMVSKPAFVFYWPGYEVAPNDDCGPLCVFTELMHAEYFMRSFILGPAQIWECEYTPSGRKQIWYFTGSARCRRRLSTLPTGTALADSVILTKMIKDMKDGLVQ